MIITDTDDAKREDGTVESNIDPFFVICTDQSIQALYKTTTTAKDGAKEVIEHPSLRFNDSTIVDCTFEHSSYTQSTTASGGSATLWILSKTRNGGSNGFYFIEGYSVEEKTFEHKATGVLSRSIFSDEDGKFKPVGLPLAYTRE